METAEIISVSVAVLLIAAEIVCLMFCSRLKCRSFPLCILLPVHRDDGNFSLRLSFLSSLIEQGEPFIGSVLLMDTGADEGQTQQCSEFCQRCHAAKLILPGDIEEEMKKYLHFD